MPSAIVLESVQQHIRVRHMEILRAEEMGFCAGVRRAIEIMEAAAGDKGPIRTLGAIVHNPQVVERLRRQGVEVIEHLDQADGAAVAITSHGVGPDVDREIASRGLPMVDATCPLVRQVHKAARALSQEGYGVVVFGESGHAEVQGILGWAGPRSLATTDPQDVQRERARLGRKLGVVCQTTQSPAALASFVSVVAQLLGEGLGELRVMNTICQPTIKHQSSAVELATRVDFMLVVGGKTSANTRRLAELCRAAGPETHHIESAEEIDRAWLVGRERVGVTAGASTPDWVIEEVIEALRRLDSPR